MLDLEKIKALKWAEPFRPFEIELDDGRVILITEPLTVGWAPEISTLIFPYGRDGSDWIKFEHVKAVRPAKKPPRRRKAS